MKTTRKILAMIIALVMSVSLVRVQNVLLIEVVLRLSMTIQRLLLSLTIWMLFYMIQVGMGGLIAISILQKTMIIGIPLQLHLKVLIFSLVQGVKKRMLNFWKGLIKTNMKLLTYQFKVRHLKQMLFL